MGYGEKPLDYKPFHKLHLNLVPLIPYSAIPQIILVRSLISYFMRVENKTLKQRLKQKRRFILKYLQSLISLMPILFSGTEQK